MAENHHSDRKPPLLKREAVWFALLLAITVCFYWKLVLTDQYIWFDHPDMAYLEIPRLEMQAREIHQGRFPLWDPYQANGQPLIGQTQPGPLFPSTLLFLISSLRGGYLRFSHLNALWVGIHFLAAWFCYLLVRELGLSRVAAATAGSIFAFGGFPGTVAWLDVANGVTCTPLILLMILRARRGATPLYHAALGGLFLGLSWLGGHHEVPLLVSMAAAIIWGGLLIRDRRMWRCAAIFFAIAFLIGAVQTLPMIEYGRLSWRWVGLEKAVAWNDKIPYTMQTLYSLPPRGLLYSLVLAGSAEYADTSSYAGWIAVTLAAIGVAARWNEWMVRRATLAAALAAAFSLGASTPLHGVLYGLIPALNKARIPSRGMALFHLALVLLAAYGLESVLSDTSSRWTRRFRIFLACAGAAVTVIAMVTGRYADDLLLMGALACLTGSAVLGAWQHSALSRSATAACLLVLILMELTGASTIRYPSRFSKEGWKFARVLDADRDIADHLRAVRGPYRVLVNDNDIGMNFGDWHAIDSLIGYSAGVTANIMRHEMHTPRVQSLFGITHYVGKKPDRPEMELTYRGNSGNSVYRVPNALPRVRAVHETIEVTNEDQLREAIRNPGTDLSRVAVFLGPAPRLQQCAGEDRVTLTGRTTDTVSIDAELSCTGLIVLSETMYPGWKAWVDGKPAPLLEVYGAFRSLVAEGGRHKVEMKYQPASVYWGAAMLLLGLMATVALRFLSL